MQNVKCSCGRDYTRDEFYRLALRGQRYIPRSIEGLMSIDIHGGGRWISVPFCDVRDCHCGSTIALLLPEGAILEQHQDDAKAYTALVAAGLLAESEAA
jgi:hypothetical protein